MAYIVGSTPDGYDYRYSPHGVTGLEYNGNQFIFAAEGAGSGVGDEKLHILKSTDSGATWSDTDSVVLGPTPSYCICQNGAVAYILSTDTYNGGTNDLCADLLGWSVDLTSGAATPLSLSSAPQVYKFWWTFTPTGYQVQKCVGLSLVKLSSGAMWFVFQGSPEPIASKKYARLNVCSFDGSSFGSPVEIGGQAGVAKAYTQGPCCIDPSDNLHLIITAKGFFEYYHVAMSSTGTFGSIQTVESDSFFTHLDPPEEISNLINFSSSGNKIGFVGVNDSLSADGDITFYYGDASLNPTWVSVTVSASGGSAVVINASMGSGLSTSINILDGKLYVFWTVSGTAPNWRVSNRAGRIAQRSATVGSFGTWSTESDLIVAPVEADAWSAAIVNSWTGTTIGIGVFGGFTGIISAITSQLGLFNAITSGGGGGSTPIEVGVGDALSNLADVFGYYCLNALDNPPDTLADLWDDAVQTHISSISGGGGGNGGTTGTGTLTHYPPPNYPPVGLPSCVFEFYEMQKPEEVEILPVPKKYDQLGPMRFDKIGKIFGFRARLIVNGTIAEMPYSIYGDDSESNPHLNSPLFSGTFPVRSGFDNVYEIQLPKSINTDIFRLTLGPTTDSFHRYNVLVKVHLSGMQGQAKWLPIR